MMSEKDLYACLGVERTSGDSDIRKVQLTLNTPENKLRRKRPHKSLNVVNLLRLYSRLINLLWYSAMFIGAHIQLLKLDEAYRRLAILYHPDKNKNEADKDKFKEIAHAYNILSDPEKRYKYDQESLQSTSSGGTSYSTYFSYGVQKQSHQRQKQEQLRQEELRKQKKNCSPRPQQNRSKKSFFDANDFFGSDAASHKEK